MTAVGVHVVEHRLDAGKSRGAAGGTAHINVIIIQALGGQRSRDQDKQNPRQAGVCYEL